MEQGWREDLCHSHEGQGGQEDMSTMVPASLGATCCVPRLWAGCWPPSCSHSPVAGILVSPRSVPQGPGSQLLGKCKMGHWMLRRKLNCQVPFWGEKTCEILVGVVARRPVAFSFQNRENPSEP